MNLTIIKLWLEICTAAASAVPGSPINTPELFSAPKVH